MKRQGRRIKSKRAGGGGAAADEITMLPIAKILRDAQSRASIDQAVVDDYAADMDRGAVFPPLHVFHDGAAYHLSRGGHRIEAMEKNGRKLAPCIIHQGTLRDAILHSVADNATHGCRRTAGDKRRCVELLLADPEWRKWSDRKIAEQANVSQPLVSSIRRDAPGAVCDERIVTRGGATFTMRVAGINNGTAAASGAQPGEALTPPLKWHGGKQPLARRIIALMPPHTTYVEPYAGGLGVLLAKSAADVSEIVNDIDGALTNFWNVLRDRKLYRKFLRSAQATAFCEATWKDAEKHLADADPARRAWAFFVRNRQSLAGRMDSFTPLTVTRTRRGMNEQVAAWLSAVEGLPQVHERLARVAILNRDALDVIRQHDAPTTLFYCDPPYVSDSRSTPDVYAHEMTAAQHAKLLAALKNCQGKVILSGYASDQYDRELRSWSRLEIDRANSAASGDSKRRVTEIVWCNFTPPAVATAAERKSA